MTDLPTRIEALAERAEALYVEDVSDLAKGFRLMRACYRAQKLLAEAEVICGGVEAHPKRVALLMRAEAIVKEAES